MCIRELGSTLGRQGNVDIVSATRRRCRERLILMLRQLRLFILTLGTGCVLESHIAAVDRLLLLSVLLWDRAVALTTCSAFIRHMQVEYDDGYVVDHALIFLPAHVSFAH